MILFRPTNIPKTKMALVPLLISTKLDIYVYKYKDEYIYKDLLQAICLVRITTSLNFLPEINTFLYQILSS